MALAALASIALALTTGCQSQEAILLLIRPPSGVQLSQYEVKIQDRASRTLVYQSGIQPVAAVTSGRDLFIEPLRVGLKLSKAGSFLVFVRAAVGTLAPEGSKPQQRTSEYFFATIVQTAGTTEINGSLLEVDPEYDRDFDHFPDAIAWPAANQAAKVGYQSRLEVLDCVDRDPAPTETQLPAGLYAAEMNPLAMPRCGLPIDVSCDAMAPVCKDTDGDGENEATDCDDSDAKRFHNNPRPRNCCTCTDHKSCETNHGKRQDLAVCQPARCDDSFDFDCTGQVVSCFIDEDCDGYSPNDSVPSQRDCDDNNPDVHPGAAKKCSDPSHDWACDGNPRGGCVTCDLDGDGYQRLDVASACPDSNDIHPGKLDCDDNDRGVFPESTRTPGATLLVPDLKQNEGGGSVGAALRRLCFNTKINGTAQDADCDNSPRLGCPPAMVSGRVCDVDGDGFPNANPGCNPGNLLAMDCDDTDYQTFPGAPDKCGDAAAQNCSTPVACTMDADKDGYNSDVDCDDTDAKRHPFATELCNGLDDDCDGLIDELNPSDTGSRMIESHVVAGQTVVSILSCTDSSIGDCGQTVAATAAYTGRCVCTGLLPGKHAPDAMRKACPGTRDDGATAPKCFGAMQPALQTCKANASNLLVADEDCDGRKDAPDGKNLKEYGDACGVTTGACVAGKVVGCDATKVNKFSKLATPSFTVSPPFTDDRQFLVCDGTAVYPSTELCDQKDNDCNAILDDCSGAGITSPKCCLNVNMCLDLSSNFNYCGSCTGACSAATATVCAGGSCKCGTDPACAGARGLCNGTGCVQCLLDNDCMGVTGKPRCKGADSCVQCLASADCVGTPDTPACDTTTNTCVPCYLGTGCADPLKPVCDPGAGYICRQCLGAADCKDPLKPVCDTAGGYLCRECVGSTDCKDPLKPVCDSAGGNVCRACVGSTDCKDPLKPVCDTAGGHVCRECLASGDCKNPLKPVCDAAGGYVCRECLANADCKNPLKPVCDPALYVCRCNADADCNTLTPKCENTALFSCVQCLNDPDCSAVTGKPRCEKATTYSCVECLAGADCASTMCNMVTHVCM